MIQEEPSSVYNGIASTNYGVILQEFTHELKTNNTRMVWNSVHRNVLYKILDSYRLFQVGCYWRKRSV